MTGTTTTAARAGTATGTATTGEEARRLTEMEEKIVKTSDDVEVMKVGIFVI